MKRTLDILKIIQNLFYNDESIVLFINYNNAKIVDDFTNIINFFMNSLYFKNNNELIKSLFLCLSYLVSGPNEVKKVIFKNKSQLPKLIIQIIMETSDINIYLKVIILFHNILITNFLLYILNIKLRKISIFISI